LLDAAMNDESAQLYIRVHSARALLQLKKLEPEVEPATAPVTPSEVVTVDGQQFIQIRGARLTILLPKKDEAPVPSLEALASMQVEEEEVEEIEPVVNEPVKRGSKREIAKRIRDRKRLAREMEAAPKPRFAPST
jgi:hypothetical protein